ncbi:hypothetical protein [Gulosibacter molinativorax]|uniref:hypothetical protein n=1 Tax=Gulosibacter molinativorax TaxID=256821 RepID=UPI0011B22C22|nr:hypothetical protein [Gulosibacter molinativorax]
MSSSLEKEMLFGSTRPRVEKRPNAAGSHADRALRFLDACGLTLDEWQRYVVSALVEVDDEGRWASSEFGLLVARQNGKGEILLAYDLLHLFMFPRADKKRKTILHSAHEVKTSVDAFERLAGVVESVPQLMARVDNIYTANGKEGIVLKRREGQRNGDRVRFIARTKKSGRGFTADIRIDDEAQEESLQANNALAYTQSQITNPQALFTGTVPEDGVNDAEVWEALRDRGRKGIGARTGWMEWSPEGSDDPDVADAIDPGDLDALVAANPSLGWRMPIETVVDQLERANTDPDGYLRERLSVWPNRRPVEAQALSELDLDRWRDSEELDATLGDVSVIAIAAARNAAYCSVSAASRFDDDTIFVEHVRTDRGTMWVAEFVKSLKADLGDALVVLDSKNAAMILVDLERAGVKFLSMDMNEVAAAHAMFIEGSNLGLIVHRGQAELTQSLASATTRKIGQAGMTWDASDSKVPVSHAQSVTWAAWGLRKQEARPKREPAPPPPKPAVLTRDSVARDETNLNHVRF